MQLRFILFWWSIMVVFHTFLFANTDGFNNFKYDNDYTSTLVDAMYFTSTVGATVAFGDIHPVKPWSKMTTIGLLIVGIIVMKKYAF